MAEKKISQLTAKGATVADTDLLVISESAGGGAYNTKSVTGANVKALVTDANMTTTDITTNNVSTTKHGFAPKAPNDATKFLDGTGAWSTPASGGLTKFTEAENTSAPNTTVYVDSLTAAASTTNADVAIVPKGTGAFMLDIPDGTATGGNKRGANAVDLSTYRTNAANVASGQYSVVLGQNSRATNNNAVAIGSAAISTSDSSVAFSQASATNVQSFAHGARCSSTGYGSVAFGGYQYADVIASGDNSFASGGGATASGIGSVVIGGYNSIASGTYSYAFGKNADTFGISGRVVKSYSIDGINISGHCQSSTFALSVRTTGNTATTLTVGGGAAGTANQVILSNQSCYRFKGTIVGKKSGTTDIASWDIDGLIVRGANAAATTLNVSNVTLVQNTPAWGTPTLAADTTNGGLRVQVTGAAATNIQWTAVIETTEVIYA